MGLASFNKARREKEKAKKPQDVKVEEAQTEKKKGK